MKKQIIAAIGLAAGAWASSSCAPGGFRDETNIAGVRILASKATLPYARPGDPVSLDVLAIDGRPNKPESMQVYWLPFVCKNPPGDAYYGCFQGPASGGGGADGGVGDAGPGGVLGGASGIPLPLQPGTTQQFTMPADAITSHPYVLGTADPYGLVFLFNIACAGHVELLPRDPNNENPVQIPFGCFDQAHHQLGPDDYVIGFTRVYAFDHVTNANPVIDHVDVAGKAVDLAQGFTTAHCTASRRANCPQVRIGPVVPADSWEVNPEIRDADGMVLHEEIWADFYSTFGQFNDSARLLYDASKGAHGGPDQTDGTFLPPDSPGDGFIWIVVHDNRGGAAWVTVPVHVT
jgi:hypothetical protein